MVVLVSMALCVFLCFSSFFNNPSLCPALSFCGLHCFPSLFFVSWVVFVLEGFYIFLCFLFVFMSFPLYLFVFKFVFLCFPVFVLHFSLFRFMFLYFSNVRCIHLCASLVFFPCFSFFGLSVSVVALRCFVLWFSLFGFCFLRSFLWRRLCFVIFLALCVLLIFFGSFLFFAFLWLTLFCVSLVFVVFLCFFVLLCFGLFWFVLLCRSLFLV